MNYSIAEFALLGFLTFALVGVITPPIRRLALRIDAVDAPNLERKSQKEPVPYLGGVAIAIGVVAASYGSLLVVDPSMNTIALASTVLVPALAISAMGLWDDLRGLQPWPRLIAQTFTGVVVATILIVTDTMGVAFGNTFLNYLITTIWIVGVCNSINFFDNHDGGAAGTVAVITFFLFFIAYDRQQILVSALAIVTAGATAGAPMRDPSMWCSRARALRRTFNLITSRREVHTAYWKPLMSCTNTIASSERPGAGTYPDSGTIPRTGRSPSQNRERSGLGPISLYSTGALRPIETTFARASAN